MKKKIVYFSMIGLLAYLFLPSLLRPYLRHANTEYAPGFSYKGYAKISPGMKKEDVETLIGKPFTENNLTRHEDKTGANKDKSYDGYYSAYYSHLNNNSWVSKYLDGYEINANNILVQYTNKDVVDTTYISRFDW